MAEHPSNSQDCELCRRIRECDVGAHPGALLELPSGWAVLGDSQQFEGYSLLLSRAPVTELHELPDAARRQLLDDMALLARTVWNVTQPHKLNYEALGNQVAHLHWHVFPRQLAEAEPLKPVWGQIVAGEAAAQYQLSAQHDTLKAALRDELRRLLHERDDKVKVEAL